MKMHACGTFPHFLHGADYNPEQWLHDKSVWDEDMRLMKLANCNEMSVGIFSWAKLEPEEGKYDFSFLDEILEKIGANGGKVFLATPSGARPRWMAEKYPEVLRVGSDGQREHFRARHNHCLTSPVYRQKVAAINELLAIRYGKNPVVVGWHISNEYGGECRCPLCTKAFQDFLERKFGTIENLNQAYWTTFWSHTYDRFDQIEPPAQHTEVAVHGLNLDWKRFITQQTASFIENEVAPIRRHSRLPVTVNMMYGFRGLDYHRIAQCIDIASWDSYPEWHSRPDKEIAQETAFWHDLYRSLKGRPFLLMESTPSLVNWKPYNKTKAPGLDVLSGLQAVAHGSDSVQYFQWRKSRGSSEKLHGAVVGHDGTEHTRVFRSVQRTGQILKQLDAIAGTVTKAKVAVVFDWENMWALEDAQAYAKDNKQYMKTCYAYHRLFWERGIDCDIVSPKEDLSGYRLVVAPMLYLVDAPRAERLRSFVEGGGILYATYMLGTVDENDLCHLGGIPGGLTDVFGILAEEIDTLYPHQRCAAQLDGLHEVIDYCELLQLRGAETVAEYASDWYKGSPAVTRHSFGKGVAVYQACRDTGSLAAKVMEGLLAEAGIGVWDLPEGMTVHSRTDGEKTYLFVENYGEAAELDLPVAMKDMLTGEVTCKLHLEQYGFAVLE